MAAAFSCDGLNETPVFKEEDSFVYFSSSSITADETAGTIQVPVEMACIDPIDATVSISVEEGTAREGVDFELVNPSAVATFADGARAVNFEINILSREGEYTGDLTFTLTIASAGSLNVGAENSCIITIQDVDHPLSSILGTYTGLGTSYWGGDYTGTVEFTKDDSDVTVVWISDPMVFTNATYDFTGHKIYGIVSDDLQTITIPLPQGPYDFPLYEEYYDVYYVPFDGYEWYDSGNVVLTATDNGFETTDMSFGGLYSSDGYTLDAGYGYWDLYMPGMTYTKQ